jgi:hypothetical protein
MQGDDGATRILGPEIRPPYFPIPSSSRIGADRQGGEVCKLASFHFASYLTLLAIYLGTLLKLKSIGVSTQHEQTGQIGAATSDRIVVNALLAG